MRRLFEIIRSVLDVPPAARGARTDSDSISLALEHARDGYRNAQDVIKFVDTKSTIVTGLSTLFAGFLIASAKWSIESSPSSHSNFERLSQAHPYFAFLIFGSIIVSLVAAMICLTAAVWSVVARLRPGNLNSEFTVLFPMYSEGDELRAKRYFRRQLQGMQRSDVLEEYEDQLRVVGMILCRKLRHNRIACIALLVQVASVAIALTLFALPYVIS
jgi:hypothetical protein